MKGKLLNRPDPFLNQNGIEKNIINHPLTNEIKSNNPSFPIVINITCTTKYYFKYKETDTKRRI